MSLISVPNIFGTSPTKIFADTWNANFLALTSPLSGLAENIEFKFIFNGASPVLKLNQKGIGHILKCFLNTQYLCGITNLGQIESNIAVGTAPLSITSTTKVANLNVGLFDDLAHAQILELIGGTLTGFLSLHADPDANMKVSTKQYADSKAPTFMPAGVKLMFGTDPPAGWTRVNETEDRLPKLSKAAEVIGNAGGAWNFQGFTVDPTALNLSQLPAHSHLFTYSNNMDTTITLGASITVAAITTSGLPNVVTTQNAGTGAGHSHGWNDTGNWRPLYEVWCIATKG